MSVSSFFGNRKFSTAIIKTPNNKYTIVGSVPIELTYTDKNSLNLPITRVKSFNTENEAIQALLELGLIHFQITGGAWYDNHIDYMYDLKG